MSSRELTEREQWFVERILKRVYRTKTSCDCIVCANVLKYGLEIVDRNHALYLSEMEALYQMDGERVKYFDTNEEAEAYEKDNPE